MQLFIRYLSLSFLLPLWTGISGSRLTGLTGEMLEEWLSCSCSKRAYWIQYYLPAIVADPDTGFGAFLTPGSGIRILDGKKIQRQDPV
jgi:hypothetical protein